MMKRITITLIAFVAIIISVENFRYARATDASSTDFQAQIASNTAQVAALNQQIAAYKAELQRVGSDKKTLQMALNALELQRKSVQAQVTITQMQISTTRLQIQQLGGEITDTAQAITASQTALDAYLWELQKDEDTPLLLKILQSGNLAQVWNDVTATMQVQDAVAKNMKALQGQKSTLADSKSASENKQTTLATQQEQLVTEQRSLSATVQSKNQLLTATNAKESNYEKLLAEAELQLQSLAIFTQNAGGSKLLGNQTSCDSWGCYYNQRDAAWGSDPLDGTKYTLANAGCLVTAVAMVLTHYGYRDVTPVTINANPANFAPYAPDLLLMTIDVNGMTVTRKIASLDAILATGHPAIVGLHADGGTHFVVFVSGSRGRYIMRDPYVTNGKDVSFSAYYSLKDIYSTAKVVINTV